MISVVRLITSKLDHYAGNGWRISSFMRCRSPSIALSSQVTSRHLLMGLPAQPIQHDRVKASPVGSWTHFGSSEGKSTRNLPYYDLMEHRAGGLHFKCGQNWGPTQICLTSTFVCWFGRAKAHRMKPKWSKTNNLNLTNVRWSVWLLITALWIPRSWRGRRRLNLKAS